MTHWALNLKRNKCFSIHCYILLHTLIRINVTTTSTIQVVVVHCLKFPMSDALSFLKAALT